MYFEFVLFVFAFHKVLLYNIKSTMIATLFYIIRKVGKELDTEKALMNRSKGQDFIFTNELLKLSLQ